MYIYNILQNLENIVVVDYLNIGISVIGILLSLMIFIDVGMSQSTKKTTNKTKKTNWYYQNDKYDRENVIEQIKIASELITSFCYELSTYFTNVFISNVAGNHSRIDKKEEALHNERLDDLIGWIVGQMLSHIDNIVMLNNKIDNGIATMEIRDNLYVAVHGDYDAFTPAGLANLITMLGYRPYAVTYGHKHTSAVDEYNDVKMIRGGSLAGSGDDFTIEKRLRGKPSQMVCVCSEKGVEAYYPVELH